MSKVHALKIDPEHYKTIKDNTKNFEIRYNDRDYQVGDRLLLHEYDRNSHQFTKGEPIEVVITYLLADDKYLKPSYVCLGIRRTELTMEDEIEFLNREIKSLKRHYNDLIDTLSLEEIERIGRVANAAELAFTLYPVLLGASSADPRCPGPRAWVNTKELIEWADETLRNQMTSEEQSDGH